MCVLQLQDEMGGAKETPPFNHFFFFAIKHILAIFLFKIIKFTVVLRMVV